MKRNILKISALVIVLALTFALAACNGIAAEAEELSYVSVKINPEIDMAVDDDNTVVAVYAANEDAEILLSDVDLTGMDAEDAIEEFVDMATEAGYIDEESTENEVEIGVICEQNADQLRNRLKERVGKYFSNNGIFGHVTDATLSLYADQAAELGVSTGKMKIILKALDLNPDLDINELKDMPTNELIALCRDTIKGNGMNATLMNAFKSERTEILAKYPELHTLRLEIETLEAQLLTFEAPKRKERQSKAN